MRQRIFVHLPSFTRSTEALHLQAAQEGSSRTDRTLNESEQVPFDG